MKKIYHYLDTIITEKLMIEMSLVYSIWNPGPAIDKQLEEYRTYSDELRERFEVIWVDDHSSSALEIGKLDFKLNLKIARITDDIYWNICGAKNLGFKLAKADWVFSTDHDHMFYKEEDLRAALDMNKTRKTAYFLKRLLPDGRDRKKDHPNTFIIHKDDFWDLGGYDEDFSGHRGFSDHMIHQQMKAKGFKRSHLSIRVKEYKEFTCKDPGNRNFAHNSGLVARKMRELTTGKYNQGKAIRFNWEIVRDYE